MTDTDGPLDALNGRDRLIEFAALRCAAVDDVEWEALLPHRKDRYRDLARAVFMTLPHHIGGQLWEYVDTKPPWSGIPMSPRPEGDEW